MSWRRERIITLALVGVASLAACSVLTDLGELADDGGGADVITAMDASRDAFVIQCGAAASCVAPDVCCAVCNGSSSCNFTFTCVDGSAACATGTVIACSDPGSCPAGRVCCGIIGSGGGYLEQSMCLTQAACDASAPSVDFCNPNVASPCPNGGQCLLSKTGEYAQLYECR